MMTDSQPPSGSRQSGVFLKASGSELNGIAVDYYLQLEGELARVPEDSEERIILESKRAELINLLTPLQVFIEMGQEDERMLIVLRDRLIRLMEDPRYVGQHEFEVVEQLRKRENVA